MMLNSIGLKTRLLEGEVLTFFSVLQEMIDTIEIDSQAKEVGYKAQTCQTCNTAEMKWIELAQVCCFYYHPELVNKNLTLTSLVYNLNPRKVEDWCTKSSMIRIWREVAKGITVSHIISCLRDRWRNCKGFQDTSHDVLVKAKPDKYLSVVIKDGF